jgi:hypothetical protein
VHSTRSASDKVYQLLAHGLWFSPGTPASSTTKTGRHDIAEILLKAALNTKNQSSNQCLNNHECQSYPYAVSNPVMMNSASPSDKTMVTLEKENTSRKYSQCRI